MSGELATIYETQELVPLPIEKKAVRCQCVYTVKLNPNGTLARLKAHLVAKGYSQTYGVNYQDTFSPIAKIASVELLISLVTYHQTLHQLDIKKAFLLDILDEEVYMKQPPRFVARGEYGKVCRL